MADQNAVTNGGGDPRQDDTFEMDLREILEDGPDLDDMSNTVQSGSPKKHMSRSYSGSCVSATSFGTNEPQLTRSFTVPPGVFSSLLISLQWNLASLKSKLSLKENCN